VRRELTQLYTAASSFTIDLIVPVHLHALVIKLRHITASKTERATNNMMWITWKTHCCAKQLKMTKVIKLATDCL